MEKIKTIIDNVKTDLVDVKADVTNESNSLSNSKSNFKYGKKQPTFKEIPESVKTLFDSLSFDVDVLISADDLAILIGKSRQTILNYTRAGILEGQKKIGDKSMYYNLKESLVSLFFSILDKDFRDDLRSNEVNIICIMKNEAETDKCMGAIKHQYSEDKIVTFEKLKEIGVSSCSMKPDISKVIDTTADLVKKEFDNKSDMITKESQIEDVDNYNRQVELTSKYRKEFASLLSKCDFAGKGIDVDMQDVSTALSYLAEVKAQEDMKAYKSAIKKPEQRMEELAMSYKYTSDNVGKSYEKLFRRAYKRELGKQSIKAMMNVLQSEHIFLNTYVLTGDTPKDLISIDSIFNSLNDSYRVILMGYSSLDDFLKGYIDTKIKAIESFGSCYEVTTM